jgi:hypothetical protein
MNTNDLIVGNLYYFKGISDNDNIYCFIGFLPENSASPFFCITTLQPYWFGWHSINKLSLLWNRRRPKENAKCTFWYLGWLPVGGGSRWLRGWVPGIHDVWGLRSAESGAWPQVTYGQIFQIRTDPGVWKWVPKIWGRCLNEVFLNSRKPLCRGGLIVNSKFELTGGCFWRGPKLRQDKKREEVW